MKYTAIPTDTFSSLQLNAGVLLADFTPASGTFLDTDLIGATSGGVSFSDSPSFKDFAEDIDNAPKNMKEFKKLTDRDIKLSGTYVSLKTALAKSLIGAADIDGNDSTKIVPRKDLSDSDFDDIWWVGDYSDKNGATNGGYIAIHLKNALSTGGFKVQSSDEGKGQYAFEYTAHYSITAQDEVPYEVYIKAGASEPTTTAGSGTTE